MGQGSLLLALWTAGYMVGGLIFCKLISIEYTALGEQITLERMVPFELATLSVGMDIAWHDLVFFVL